MTLIISEHEMIERFYDNLKKSSSRVKEFMTAQEQDKPALFVDFIDGLKVAAGSAHQLAHAQENPHFLGIRDVIEKVIEVGQELPTFTGQQAGIWFKIKTSLDGIAERGRQMSVSKALSRQEVLLELDHRQKVLDLNNG